MSFSVFKDACERTIAAIGLSDWNIEVRQAWMDASDEETRARVLTNWTQRTARISWNENHPGPGPDAVIEETPEETALHEVLHILLSPLIMGAVEAGEYEAEEVNAAEHALIRRLMKVIPTFGGDEVKNPEPQAQARHPEASAKMPECCNRTDGDGMPTGGTVKGVGLSIDWQNGPLGKGDDRKEPNGAFVEGVIFAAMQRLRHFQSTRFACEENAAAIAKLEEAMLCLSNRTVRRMKSGIEGTHDPD